MLGWLLKPQCPCDQAAKVWLEYRLGWLDQQFPRSAFAGGRVVLPTTEFFPDLWDKSDEAVEALVRRVCRYMHIEPARVRLLFKGTAGRLHLVNEDGLAVPDAAGTFEGGDGSLHVVTLDRGEFENVEALVGTIAHELSHAKLLGEGRLDGDVFDNELLTDLTAVHFGFGVFLANSPRDWMSGYTKWPDSDLNKPEYMSAPMYGWALALLARARGEEKPRWADFLGSAARREFGRGQRYLSKTGDSSYRPASTLRLVH